MIKLGTMKTQHLLIINITFMGLVTFKIALVRDSWLLTIFLPSLKIKSISADQPIKITNTLSPPQSHTLI